MGRNVRAYNYGMDSSQLVLVQAFGSQGEADIAAGRVMTTSQVLGMLAKQRTKRAGKAKKPA